MPNTAPCPQSNSVLSGCSFTQFLVNQQPVYDKLILEDIRPTDGWIQHIDMGTFEAYSGVQHTLDRFNVVWPNVTKQWTAVPGGSCIGTPCDKQEHYITWGSTRLTYALEEIHYATTLLCFDSIKTVTHGREQFAQIIRDILKPATTAIFSNYCRKRAMIYGTGPNQTGMWAPVASGSTAAALQPVTFNWVVVGDEEIYLDVSAVPISKLTPQMLQLQVQPLMQVGYFGKDPFKDEVPLIELVTGLETCWELDRLGGQQGIGGVPSISGNWRFEQWDAASKYWRYGLSGQIGNYAVRVDPFELRFNYVGKSPTAGYYRFQVVLPFVNVASSGAGDAPGLKAVVNQAYQNAQYCIGFIWHRKAMQVLVSESMPVNSEMPFASRNYGGRWQFVMDNLGADVNGQPIENKRRNKGQFIADFENCIRPMYTELCQPMFFMREPACVIAIAPCNPSPGYPSQYYESDPVDCTGKPIVD